VCCAWWCLQWVCLPAPRSVPGGQDSPQGEHRGRGGRCGERGGRGGTAGSAKSLRGGAGVCYRGKVHVFNPFPGPELRPSGAPFVVHEESMCKEKDAPRLSTQTGQKHISVQDMMGAVEAPGCTSYASTAPTCASTAL